MDGTLGVSPRPVFYEELDLLGLDKFGWEYPHCHEPLLWAVNKQYYYRGEFVFEAKARKSIQKVASNQLDYEALAKRIEKKRKQKMAIVKEDCDSFEIMPLDAAEEQGRKVYQTTKIDRFLASFSGGKDSQVVLDLCTRAMPSTEFEVIYSDTGYELPPSLKPINVSGV